MTKNFSGIPDFASALHSLQYTMLFHIQLGHIYYDPTVLRWADIGRQLSTSMQMNLHIASILFEQHPNNINEFIYRIVYDILWEKT